MSIDERLEPLRRSLVMSPRTGAAVALTNEEAAALIDRLQAVDRRLAEIETELAGLLVAHSPIPRQNAQLRRLCCDLAKIVASLAEPD